jgi:S-adenosylmethionine synthetase
MTTGAVALTLTSRPPYAPDVEVVERKGLGHPDTICDRAAELLGRRLAAHPDVGHFNVDKGLLVGGAVEVGYGGGHVVRPARLLLAGRADLGILGDPATLAGDVHTELQQAIRTAPRGSLEVEILVNPPSAELAELTGARGVPLANDTSYAVVSLPRSPLERAVHAIEQHLTSVAIRDRIPLGTDVKVLAVRTGRRVSLSVAAAVLAAHVAGPDEYRQVVATVRDEVRTRASDVLGVAPDEVVVNPTAGPHLTLTGSSAEAGDDGQVGRGNRFGGLIAPMRPQSGEAPAGKNPVSHVGKTYHAIAHDIASELLARPAVVEATVELVSRIGVPITEPQAVHVCLAGRAERDVVVGTVERCLADWQGVRDRLQAGDYELF